MSLAGISIEAFRGDYENLEKMAHSAWRDEYGAASFPNLYQPEYLKFLFEPIKDKQLLIAAYKGDEIVSFFANLPRLYRFDGADYRGVLACHLVTRKEYLRQGLALAIIDHALKLNEQLKFDFALMYLEPGHRSTLMMNKLRAAGKPVYWVKKMNTVGRVLDLPKVSVSEGIKWWERGLVRLLRADQDPGPKTSGCREYQVRDLNDCLALLNQYQSRVRLALVWTEKELARELDHPEISKTLVHEKDGRVQGLISWTYHQHIGNTTERWAWVNHVAYPGLSGSERLAFVRDFLAYVKDRGCIGALEWTKKYYPMLPLYRAHFFPYFRAVNMLAWCFRRGLQIKNIPDVYEVQI